MILLFLATVLPDKTLAHGEETLLIPPHLSGRSQDQAAAAVAEQSRRQSAEGSDMRPMQPALTGVERTFDRDEIIVSKTDLRGIITYANQVFLRVAQFSEAEVLGQPHNIIRHPQMPRCVFKYLWDTIQNGREVFAYVINRTRLGDHYWVFAHVTPTFDSAGRICGYHSNRRVPSPSAVEKIKPIYARLRQEEQLYRTVREASEAGLALLVNLLASQGVSYDEFVFSLARPGQQAPAAAAGR